MGFPRSRIRKLVWSIAALLLVVGVVAAVVWRDHWWPSVAGSPSDPANNGQAAEHDDHDHGHDHAHDDANSIELSSWALRNIGYQPVTVAPSDYARTITLPAMVVERPGRSQIQVTAPMSGVISRVYVVAGMAVEPGSALFEIRLMHEELVSAQREFLRTAESLDVVRREVARLEKAGEGVIAGRRVLEQDYERQKLEASLRAERQALLLHGLSDVQVDEILRSRQLLRSLTVTAPEHEHEDEGEACSDEHLFHVQRLPVVQGQHVVAGETLCVLADHCELYIEGRAYEDDAESLRNALRNDLPISAVLLSGDNQGETVQNLHLMNLSDQIDPVTRVFRFYIPLPNEVLLDRASSEGVRFIEWQFKPGQRMELRVPVQQWSGQIVLPVDAVVEEGAETYVYQQNGDHFDRVPVHVIYRDRQSVVVAKDGALFPGDVIAGRGAYQMHLALKNRAGGGIDPHAGHNH